jgi:hypothetical protein
MKRTKGNIATNNEFTDISRSAIRDATC